jgi:hypothetical protein
MHTENRITIRGDIDHMFAVASAVEAWPRLLPYYRWVTVLAEDATGRLVEMAAHRDDFPVRWTARQRREPLQHRMHFPHVRGMSRGMDVSWLLDADGPLVHVRMVHDLTWRGWPIGPLVAHSIIGELFVKHIATKTLRTIKQYIEDHDAPPSQ